MSKNGKQFEAAKAKVGQTPYPLEEAIPLVQSLTFAKFNETVELAMRLGVNPKHADQMVRGTVVLPHGLGRSKNVLVIAGGEKQQEAEQAGRGHRRRRRDGREDPGRLDGLRGGRGDSRHDARGRQARPDSRAAGA